MADEEKGEADLGIAMAVDPRVRTETNDSAATTYTLPRPRPDGDAEKAGSAETLFYYPLATDEASENSSLTDLSIVPWAASEGDAQLASVPTWSGLTPVSEPGVVWAQRQRMINGAACASFDRPSADSDDSQMRRWSPRCSA